MPHNLDVNDAARLFELSRIPLGQQHRNCSSDSKEGSCVDADAGSCYSGDKGAFGSANLHKYLIGLFPFEVRGCALSFVALSIAMVEEATSMWVTPEHSRVLSY